MERPPTTVLLRWVAAVLVGGFGLAVLARMFHGADSVPFVGRSLLGIATIVTGLMLAAPEIVRWTVSPISALLDSILLPSEKVHPPADFTLARFYGQNLRYAEACEEYEKILHYHPDNAEAHLEGIRAAALAGNEALARKLHRHARRLMPSGDKRQLLDAVYEARHQPLVVDGDATQPEALPEAAQEPSSLDELPP